MYMYVGTWVVPRCPSRGLILETINVDEDSAKGPRCSSILGHLFASFAARTFLLDSGTRYV